MRGGTLTLTAFYLHLDPFAGIQTSKEEKVTATFPLEKGLEHAPPRPRRVTGTAGGERGAVWAHSPRAVGRRVSRGVARLLGAEPAK